MVKNINIMFATFLLLNVIGCIYAPKGSFFSKNKYKHLKNDDQSSNDYGNGTDDGSAPFLKDRISECRRQLIDDGLIIDTGSSGYNDMNGWMGKCLSNIKNKCYFNGDYSNQFLLKVIDLSDVNIIRPTEYCNEGPTLDLKIREKLSEKLEAKIIDYASAEPVIYYDSNPE